MGWGVLGDSLFLCSGLVVWDVANADGTAATAETALDGILHSVGWLCTLVMTGLVGLALVIAGFRFVGELRRDCGPPSTSAVR